MVWKPRSPPLAGHAIETFGEILQLHVALRKHCMFWTLVLRRIQDRGRNERDRTIDVKSPVPFSSTANMAAGLAA
jgi:hypothetical protein